MWREEQYVNILYRMIHQDLNSILEEYKKGFLPSALVTLLVAPRVPFPLQVIVFDWISTLRKQAFSIASPLYLSCSVYDNSVFMYFISFLFSSNSLIRMRLIDMKIFCQKRKIWFVVCWLSRFRKAQASITNYIK